MASSGNKRTRIQGINRGIILDAALEVFSAYGFRGSTIDQIAEKAGMSKPNLLYYFPRKEDIYVTVLEKTLEDWLAPFRDIDPDGDPVEELRKYIMLKMKLSASKPESSRLFANEILHGAPAIQDFLKTNLKRLVDEKAAVIRHWIEQGKLAPVDPHHLIFMIWATTQHYSDFDVQVRAILPDETANDGFFNKASQAILAILLDGIRPRQG
ncbi:HTH-type transcriptional regulator RutR [Hoeflea prorocentri]|uniref:HTH-type transcriptional regulator RutR n=1 Tax=Hoeflea prorocentri TaxID=1922333 RepID=A0A9X3ZI48_9HYPH|nr:HTH-type transcriptional regulator RutR [Hoeflea prorocentri]MCY6381360.1 HTH-type transcriptional regulator RutR [Hoeflea prorocentri]MDA5399160.1 HTH-type transcriptional regulator RutR [Hoeflea prorocentri]